MTKDEIVTVTAVDGKVDELAHDFQAFRSEVREQWAAMLPVIEAYKAIAQWARFAKWGTGIGACGITIIAGLRALAIL